MGQMIVSFITKIDPARLSELESMLDEMADDPVGNRHIPFGSLPRLHFASLVIFPDEQYGPYLVFEHNIDGPMAAYLDDLLDRYGEGLHRIYRCCLRYSAAGPTDRGAMVGYLRAHLFRPHAYHIGTPGRSVERIHREANLREALERFLDGVARTPAAAEGAGKIRRMIQEVVAGDRNLAWVRDVRPRLTLADRYLPWARLIGTALGALALSPVLLPIGVVWAAVLRWKETHDPPPAGPVAHEHVDRVASREDRSPVVQNHMASLSVVKPGPFRRGTLRLVLWLAGLFARTQTNGKLGGLATIHFAHWALIDDGRRMLFFSNFDGSWESYLDDFIDLTSMELTGIWSNTVGFPRTRWLVLGGARDVPNFKAISRINQAHTNVWYSAYPELTVQQIDRNSTIREQMFEPLDGQAEQGWLRSF